jgi:hypothetical protein
VPTFVFLLFFATGLRVGRITVTTVPLFSAEEAGQSTFYGIANRLAVPTRAALVRKFLLFHEGEPFDPARLRESERTLRALDFLKSVTVTPLPPRDGVVDVTVATQDDFTTNPEVDFSNEGGRSLYDVEVTQSDLFGTGGEATLHYGNGRERSTRSLELRHPALFGAYWNGDVLYAKNSDGDEEKLVLQRPLFSNMQSYTGLASFEHLLQNSRVYANGDVASLFRQEHRELALACGPIVAANDHSTTRLVAGADVLRDEFTLRQGLAPDDRRFSFLEAGIDHTAINYLTLDHVDLGLRDQDFNLGASASLYAGLSAGVRRFRGSASIGRKLAPRAFVLTQLSATTRAGRTNRNEILSDDTRLVVRTGDVYPQTLAARLRFDYASDADRDLQYFADGQNGLRAYPNFAFAGAHHVVMNVEERLFLGHEWLEVFEPGVAAFADSGEATNGPLTFRGLRTDAGAGVRFSIARFNSALIRIDVAYAFNNSPLSRRGVVVSLATTQAF